MNAPASSPTGEEPFPCERQLALIASIPVIVWEFVIPSQRFTYVSQAAEEDSGYPVRRWIDDPSFWRNHVYADDRWVIDYCEPQTREGRGHEFEYRMIHADGRAVWLRDAVSVVLSDGAPTVMRGVMVEISEMKEASIALEEFAVSSRRSISIVVECDSDVGEIVGDENQLEQVVMNLILNARDAMEETGTVTLGARRLQARGVEIYVRGTGRGISAEILDRIFEPMFTTKRNGTGLGLAVAHQVVSRHGGVIHAESELGAGTTFHVIPPAA